MEMEAVRPFVGLSVLLALAAGSPDVAMGQERPIREGRPFPDLHLPSLADGTLRSVSSFRGAKTLLLIFASW